MFDYETSMEIMTDSPAISSEDFSSPYEEDEGNSPNLRIIMAHADNGYGNDYGPPSALDTSRAGGTCFEEGMFNTLENLDHDDDDPKFYEILNGAEGTEGTERNPEEDLELDLSPNEPDLERVSVENSDPPPFAGPKTTLSTEASGLKGNVASGSVHRYPTTRFNSLYPSITAVQPPQNDTGKPVSSSQYSRHAARSDSNGATTINREMSMPLQHQTFNSNTQSRVQAPSPYVQSVRPVPSTDTNTSRFDHTLPQRHFAQQARNQPQQRPASTEPSTFQLQQQQQQVGRRKPQRFYPHSSFLEDRRQTGYQTQTASPRFEQGQLFPHDNGLQGFQGSGSPQLDTHYAQLHDSDNKSYDSTLWQHLQHTPGEIMVLPHRGVINAEDDTLFGSMLDAKMWREQHLVPTGKVDDTIPRSPEEQKHVVKRLFDAINDTSDAMTSTYVKYFEEHKYTAQFIESVCWVVLVWPRLLQLLS